MYCDPSAPPRSAIGRSRAISRATAAWVSPDALRTATASLIRYALARFLGACGRDVGRRREPLDRIQCVVELEVLDPLLLERSRSHHEPRIGSVVGLQQLVLDRRLREQVATQIDLAHHLAVLVVGIA